MNKYISTLLFYAVSFILIYVLNKLSPNAQDGGLGLGSMAIALLALVIIVLIGFNVYKGITANKDYFIIAGIHLVVLLVASYKLFL